MFLGFIDKLFGCWHSNLSFPRTAKNTVRRNSAAYLTGTYVVCLDCGKEFAYDWQRMKIVTPRSVRKVAVSDLAPKQAA